LTTIQLEATAYTFPDSGVRALDGVDLVIPPGSLVGLVGQNGSGKSTLVRHLNGLLRPTEGRVLFDGEDTSVMTVAAMASRVGLCFQDPDRQIFARSVRSEVEFGPRNLGADGPELDRRTTTALELVGLTGAADTNPYDLGYARRKLLAIASVVAMGTPIVVFDEPTTGQDAHGIALVGDLIQRLHAEGRTVLVISHDMRFVAEHFLRILVMEVGRIGLEGSPTEVFAEPAWPRLAATWLEPTYAARTGARLGLGSTPTDASVVAALRERSSA
jgi:energy-coupling factor transport system ATP-binding protein